MKNKRGQGLSTNTLILIILGLVVLAILVIGFVAGWNSLLPWIKPNNIDTLSQACNLACETGSQYSYCSEKRTVNDGEVDKFEETCNNLANSEEYISRNYGIKDCLAITCNSQ